MNFKYERVVFGHLASKSNSRRKTNWGGVIKSKPAMQFEKDFAKQVARPKEAYEGPVALLVAVWYEDRRRDLDISLLQDCIQKAGIIKNDRQIIEIHAYRGIDKKQPRVQFLLEARDEQWMIDKIKAVW